MTGAGCGAGGVALEPCGAGRRASSFGDAEGDATHPPAGETPFGLVLGIDSARLQGLVIDAQSGAGLAGVDVLLAGLDEPPVTATTDDEGDFGFMSLSAGAYALTIGGLTLDLSLSPGEVLAGLVIELEPAPAD